MKQEESYPAGGHEVRGLDLVALVGLGLPGSGVGGHDTGPVTADCDFFSLLVIWFVKNSFGPS